LNIAYLEALCDGAQSLTTDGNHHNKAAHARRAFNLAHRARRLLELAAETASRDRWDELLAPHGPPPKELEACFAAACAKAAIKYPARGEAKVYAALLDAVDTARIVADRLYQRWLETQREKSPLPEPEPGVVKIGAPLATGCRVVQSLGNSDEENAS
jgi:hypothetical protein